MFRRLMRSLLGEFPPKNAALCNKCRTSYFFAGIIGSSLTFDELVKLLYQYNMLCSEPCGVTTPHLLSQQHPASDELSGMLQKSGISCQNCLTSFVILSILAHNESDINRAVLDSQRKNLICNRCLLIFANKIDKITCDILSTVKGVNSVRDVIR